MCSNQGEWPYLAFTSGATARPASCLGSPWVEDHFANASMISVLLASNLLKRLLAAAFGALAVDDFAERAMLEEDVLVGRDDVARHARHADFRFELVDYGSGYRYLSGSHPSMRRESACLTSKKEPP